MVQGIRVGNWVQDEYGNVMYVYRTWQGGAELSFDVTGSDDLDCEDKEMFGVPLTEDWLKKFEQVHFWWENYVLQIGMVRYNIDIFHKMFQQESIVIVAQTDITNLAIADIKYVHELQNLYMVLAHEELILR